MSKGNSEIFTVNQLIMWTPQMLPPTDNIETKRILKSLPKAHAALAELKGIALSIPNQNILILYHTLFQS